MVQLREKSEEEISLAALSDIEESLVALSANETEMSDLFNLRMRDAKVRGNKFGDIFLDCYERSGWRFFCIY